MVKEATTFRLSSQARGLIKELAEAFGLSQAEVVEMAVGRMAEGGSVEAMSERLDKLKELSTRASGGPWFIGPDPVTVTSVHTGEAVAQFLGEGAEANAAFVADARKAVPGLVREVERLKAVEEAAVIFLNGHAAGWEKLNELLGERVY